MIPIPAPTAQYPREEWADGDFDLDGDGLVPDSDKEDDAEPWRAPSHPPATSHAPQHEPIDTDGDVSTIKVSAIAGMAIRPRHAQDPEEDMEDAFALPHGLSHLSLCPLNRKLSKTSMDWSDKENTASSSSTTSLSEGYTSLGFTLGTSPSSISTASRPGSQGGNDETDEDLEGDLDGLVLPASIFDSRQGGKELARLLDVKKRLPPVGETSKPIEEGDADFESGLVINDDVDLNPKRLLVNHQNIQKDRAGKQFMRSKSAPSNPTVIQPRKERFRYNTEAVRRTSGAARAKSPLYSPPSTSTSRMSPPPPSAREVSLFSTAVEHIEEPSVSSPSSSKASSLRAQKSLAGFRTSTRKTLSRKASLPSLIDKEGSEPASTSAAMSHAVVLTPGSTYVSSTAASRAKMAALSESQSATITPTRSFSPPFGSSQRLTLPATLSRVKTRPSIASVFPNFTSISAESTIPEDNNASTSRAGLIRPSSTTPQPSLIPSSRILRRPKRARLYGDGSELDAIEDLPTDREKESRFRVTPKPQANRVPGGQFSNPKGPSGKPEQKRKEASLSPDGKLKGPPPLLRRKARLDMTSVLGSQKLNTQLAPRKPTLIRNLSGAGAPKVIGDMRWNPQALRWEGNEHILRDFEAATGSSTRPALITHLTGSSIGSPVSGFAAGARIVGNMIFDPIKMCWLSRLAPEDDEPDVFAGIADDDSDSMSLDEKGGTIRASLITVGEEAADNVASSATEFGRANANHVRQTSESDGEQGRRIARPRLVVPEATDAFVVECKSAAVTHQTEIAGWMLADADDRTRLYYIRELATKSYMDHV